MPIFPPLARRVRFGILFGCALGLPLLAAAVPADQPAPRPGEKFRLAHEQLLAKAHAGRIDLYFLGDSITRRWGATDYPAMLAHWQANFHGWNAGNFGWGGDSTENILWRVEHGELDGVNPRVIVLLAGTNNLGLHPPPGAVDEVPRGIKAIIDVCRRKAPHAVIILTAIFPRNDSEAANAAIRAINPKLAAFADGRTIRFLNVNDRLADEQGRLFPGMTMDQLHPTVKGYEVWAEGLRPLLTELLGPRGKEDCAPPPTGEPIVDANGRAVSMTP
ncbi:GDSL-type esterase/lipase family protein [Opitutus sp. ER46]|uniref:GDSL-type esterase/lipase family protein n=1 Tax=Opitutus sp. ER46 TaxID=2161864 RepID=UPI0011B1F5A8|nr:GDSL-type esterase/lipase family protein [Opitutus sp. ER46]